MNVSSEEAKDLLMKWSSAATPLRGAALDLSSKIRFRFKDCLASLSDTELKVSSELFDLWIPLADASFRFGDKLELSSPDALGKSFVYAIGIAFDLHLLIELYEYDED